MKYNIYTVRLAKTVQTSFEESVPQSESDILKVAVEERRTYSLSKEGSIFVANIETIELDDKFKNWYHVDEYGMKTEGCYVLLSIFKDTTGEIVLEYMLTGLWTTGHSRHFHTMTELLDLEKNKKIRFGWH